ncbi:MAG TPA: hypothetical protein ENJ45_02925 [Phaeodactylibacter sp.]|nr:hypothetical protein [Phaeodactylibacter sp.]
MENVLNLKSKVDHYKKVLSNTRAYREVWKKELKAFIIAQLEEVTKEVGLEVSIDVKSSVENLEAIVMSLGEVKSGIWENVNKSIKRHLIKHNGSLIYQQLFNGKIIVLVNLPMIEGYGQSSPPKTVGIYRPEEIKPAYILRHLEGFVKDITLWEDYDDDEPDNHQKIGYHLNFMPENEGKDNALQSE